MPPNAAMTRGSRHLGPVAIVNRARLRELGFELGARAEAASPTGCVVRDGRRTVRPSCSSGSPTRPSPTATRCCSPPSTSSERAACRCPSTRTSSPSTAGRSPRSRSCRADRSDNPSPAVVEAMVECIAAKAGVAGPLPAPDLLPWGEFVVHTLDRRRGRVGRCTSRCAPGIGAARRCSTASRRSAPTPTRAGSRTTASCTSTCTPTTSSSATTARSRASSTGRAPAPAIHRFDLVAFAYDLDGHDQPIWDIVDAAGSSRTCCARTSRTHALRFTGLGDPPPPRRRAPPARPRRARPRSVRGLGDAHSSRVAGRALWRSAREIKLLPGGADDPHVKSYAPPGARTWE